MLLSSRMRCAKLGRIIGVLLLATVLAACSTIKLAYNNLPALGYWWLDGYLDFDSAQSPRVRDELAQLLAWHRTNELPKIHALLEQAEALAPGNVTPAQACALADGIRDRLLAVSTRAETVGAELALTLGDAQLQQLERKYAKTNADYRKEWVTLSPKALQEKRYDQFLERSEDFYDRLDAAQRQLVKEQVTQSVFDPRLNEAERRSRQQDMLSLLRSFRDGKKSSAEAQAALHAWVLRVADPPPGPWRDHQQALLQEGCRNIAALHNRTSAEQRAKAIVRLQAYEKDLRQLVAAR